jgi:phenylalanyl-tRNA synthetase beta chain
MLVSWKWLSRFVRFSVGVEDFAERMTLTGSEIEEIREPWKELEGVITARIVSLEEHPEKSSWKVARLDTARGEACCVTAAENVREGQMVPYGPPASTLSDGTILGIREFGSLASEGMLLSASELGLPELEREHGIFILPEETPLGVDFKKHFELDDVIFDVSITPNRGDLLSMVGMARETRGVFEDSSLLPLEEPAEGTRDWPFFFKGISKSDHLCPYFALGLLTDLVIEPSPLEAQILLVKHGIRPISNVVDATNLSMLTLGQPLHAYDADLLPEKEITVRTARDGEHLKTLDGKDRLLSPEDLCITSGNVPVGLAGVMGGESTEIRESTKVLALESAIFNREMVGATSRRLGLHSEASYRNARGVNREKALLGLHHCLGLLEQWKAGKGGYRVYSAGDPCSEPVRITLTKKKMQRILLHQRMDDARVILDRLGFEEVERSEKGRTYLAPKERLDISIEEDLIEEIGRVEGYNDIPSKIPSNLHAPGNMTPEMAQISRFREVAMGRGYSEVITYSFVAPDMFEKLLLPEEDPRNHPIKVLNPISNELSCMRTFLLPGLLQSLVKNVRGGWKDPIRIFESGRVFLRNGESHVEPPLMGGIVYAGKRKNLLQDEETFYRVKGDLLAFCESANAQISFRQASEPFGHKGQTGHICLGETPIGYLARLKPSIEDLFDLGAPAYAFEIEIAPLLDSPKKAFGYTARYPGVYRDISLLVDARNASASEVLEKIHSLKGEDAQSVLLFDAYEGKGIPQGKRSLSFSILYRHQERTLSDEEVDGQHVRLRQGLESLGYTLR